MVANAHYLCPSAPVAAAPDPADPDPAPDAPAAPVVLPLLWSLLPLRSLLPLPPPVPVPVPPLAASGARRGSLS